MSTAPGKSVSPDLPVVPANGANATVGMSTGGISAMLSVRAVREHGSESAWAAQGPNYEASSAAKDNEVNGITQGLYL